MRKIDFDITDPEFLYKMEEHTKFLFENEPRGFYWHPTYKHWIFFSMDILKEASRMNEKFSLANVSPAPFDPTPLGGRWRAGYALTLREGPHHWLAKKHSKEWLRRQAPTYIGLFKKNLEAALDKIVPGEAFSSYDTFGRFVTDTQIEMIHFPWDKLEYNEQQVLDGYHEWMRPGMYFSNFNPEFDYDKPVAQKTEFYKMFSECVQGAIDHYGRGPGRFEDTMINMTYNLSDEQDEFNDRPEQMAYMFIQSLWTVVIPTFSLSLYQNLLMRMAEQPELVKEMKENRDLVPLFAREALRLAPMKGGVRDITETFNFHDYKMDQNGRILLYTFGANRDPKYYKDPHTFNIYREDEPDPVSLAYGPHHCTGDFIVKQFMQIIINSVLDRFDTVEIATEPKRLPAMFGSTTVYDGLELKMS